MSKACPDAQPAGRMRNRISRYGDGTARAARAKICAGKVTSPGWQGKFSRGEAHTQCRYPAVARRKDLKNGGGDDDRKFRHFVKHCMGIDSLVVSELYYVHVYSCLGPIPCPAPRGVSRGELRGLEHPPRSEV